MSLTIALLYGGTSSEREVSIKGAKIVEEVLTQKGYNVLPIDTSNELGLLFTRKDEIDVAFILLHGKHGEDGTIQGLLDLLNIPYQGSGVLGSAICMNKDVTKIFYKNNDIPTPKWCTCTKDSSIKLDSLHYPLIVKPNYGGSSLGVSLVQGEKELQNACNLAFSYDSKVIIEEFIRGKEITCGILEDKNGELIALPVVEIIPKEKYAFFDYDAKYKAGETEEICPARIPKEIEERAKYYAKKIHQSLYLRDYSRTDMIVTLDGEIYVLETNTIPGMTRTSLFPLAAKTHGIEFDELIVWLIDLAYRRKTDKK